ncbi:MAG TPA: chromosomal replication initiator protein DnaA [Anaerolineae bacterium]|nr:chromosomal replication initiator protein DnaA [Anaerolineae bacterium]
MSPEAAWKATLGELELQMTQATFNTWLKDAHLIAYDSVEYVVGVRNEYAKDWLENRLNDMIVRTLSAVIGESISIRFVVLSDTLMQAAAEESVPDPQDSYPDKIETPIATTPNGVPAARPRRGPGTYVGDAPLYPRYIFSSFVVGPSNRLAHAAALSVAENPGQTYNPLFIYGGVGLGKTHLLHAIGQKCQESGYNVCYVSSETFTNDLIQSIRNQKMADFREKYRTPNVLLIDDIQFIAGKESTQEELFHTFNDLHSRGNQVVLSSDRPPKSMVTLEERLQSRFEWGLMADIQLPNLEMRKAILQMKAESLNIPLPDEVNDLIVHRIRNNIRELEGALNKVIAYAQLMDQSLTMDVAEAALADLTQQIQKVNVNQVIEMVASHFNVTKDALESGSRSRTIAFPRQIAMYLARTETEASLPQIGQHLGNRDHTTILYGYEKIAGLMETDPNLRRTVMEIKAKLYELQAIN